MARKFSNEASESISESASDASRLTESVANQAMVLATINTSAVATDANAAEVINRPICSGDRLTLPAADMT